MRNALPVCLYVCLCVSRSFCHVLFWGRQVDSVTHDDVLCPFVRLAVLL